MRSKIIGVNVVIVVLVGLLAYAFVRTSINAAASNPSEVTADARRDAAAAASRLQLDGLNLAQFLASAGSEPATLEVYAKASPAARGDAAMARCDSMIGATKNEVPDAVPSLVMLLDSQGRSLGRNGSSLGRGDNLAKLYPGVMDAIKNGRSGIDVWVNGERNDQYLVAYAPVRDESGAVVGLVAGGLPLSDELSRVAEETTGHGVKLVVLKDDELQVAASSAVVSEALEAAIHGPAKDSVKTAFESGHPTTISVDNDIITATPVTGRASKARVAIVTASPSSRIESIDSKILPAILGVTVLGLILVVASGWFLGTYISRPINELEEGLLAILNGQADKRFQLDHPDLGGLAFRIDQLLNQLMGVEEDTTDDEGRVSLPSPAARYGDAAVSDPNLASQQGPDPAKLAAEPADAYYARLYAEYVAAKKKLGEATDHITLEAFKAKIQGMEQEASGKHGKPVRYAVDAREREVVLLAIPLG